MAHASQTKKNDWLEDQQHNIVTHTQSKLTNNTGNAVVAVHTLVLLLKLD